MDNAALKISHYAQMDPTRTLTLRNAFAAQMRMRFRELSGVIRRAIIDEDVFGLREDPFAIVYGITAYQMTTPGRRAFAFETTGGKVASFMDWLHEQVEAGILQTTAFPQLGQGIRDQWTDLYIDSAYQQGIKSAHNEMIKAGYSVPQLDDIGGIQSVFNNPFHIDRVGLLHTRTFQDLKGITGTMEGQVARVLSQGMAEGRGPAQIARLLNRTINGPMGDLGITDTLGRFIPAKRRAVLLARTETIHAHAEAQLQEYENWGIVGVKAEVEFRTAGDDRVCVECEELEKRNGGIFTISQARGIIPVHPQ